MDSSILYNNKVCLDAFRVILTTKKNIFIIQYIYNFSFTFSIELLSNFLVFFRKIASFLLNGILTMGLISVKK